MFSQYHGQWTGIAVSKGSERVWVAGKMRLCQLRSSTAEVCGTPTPGNQLPAGWHVTSVSQLGTIGIYQNRVFVALIHLNAENAYRMVITARK